VTSNSPKIKTFDEVVPMIYSWTTPNVIPTGHTASLEDEGWEKIGYTEQDSVDVRIAQQASQMGPIVEKRKLWAYKARFITEGGGWFTDHDFHKYLAQQGVERFVDQGKTEWHQFAGAPKTSQGYFSAFIMQDFALPQTVEPQPYTLRLEQAQAVDQALAAFAGWTSSAP
jgi:type II restriction enzyme